MSENMITSPTTESTDDLLSHGICMAADIIFVNNNNNINSSNSNSNNNTTNNNAVDGNNDLIIDDNNDNCKLLRVNGSALNGDGGEDGDDNSNTVKSIDSNHHHNSQPERSIESGSSSSSSLSNSSSSSSSTGTSTSSTTSSSVSLISHSKSLPATEAAWVCKICEFSHKWPLIMINHLRIFHKLQSPFDQYIFKQNYSLPTESSSELVTYQPTLTNIKCKLCDIAFETDQDLEEHNEHLHSDLVWACKSCSFSNKWQQLAISHLRSAHNCHPPYTDHLYRKNSDKSSSLLQQIKSASLNFRSHLYPPPPPPPPTPPPSRSLQPSPQPQKKQHQIQSAKETPQVKSKPRQTPTPPVQQKPITVSFTLRKSLPENANSFIEHLISDDSNSSNYDTNEEVTNNESKIKTETVPESQSSGVEMAPGLKTATKDCYRRLDNDRFQCTNCGKTCGSAQGITEHYEAYHLGLNYQCKLCGFTDLWRSMLTKHLKVKHLMGKPYEKYLRRVKVEPGLDVYQANSTKHWRRRFRQKSLEESPDPVSSPKKARQSSSSSTTASVPTPSSATTSNNKKRNSNSLQEEEHEEKEEEDEVEEPKVVISKRGRKPKDTSAAIKVKAKSKRRRLKQFR